MGPSPKNSRRATLFGTHSRRATLFGTHGRKNTTRYSRKDTTRYSRRRYTRAYTPERDVHPGIYTGERCTP